jgi:hypothetical protein
MLFRAQDARVLQDLVALDALDRFHRFLLLLCTSEMSSIMRSAKEG